MKKLILARLLLESGSKNMTKTPKTDAALINNADLSEWGYGKSDYVHADFARQLEGKMPN